MASSAPSISTSTARSVLWNMIKLLKVKEKQRELAENASGGVPINKQTAGELRLHKGFVLAMKGRYCLVSAI
ncbi:hypothetical protein K1719_044899 [Acacia pycnantha]|nr:hypothetical protein K1719_044899 [Acacia pycnantha]